MTNLVTKSLLVKNVATMSSACSIPFLELEFEPTVKLLFYTVICKAGRFTSDQTSVPVCVSPLSGKSGKIQNAEPSSSTFSGMKIQSVAVHQFGNVSLLWISVSETALGDGPVNWHIVLFIAVYFLSYWHIPFQNGIEI